MIIIIQCCNISFWIKRMSQMTSIIVQIYRMESQYKVYLHMIICNIICKSKVIIAFRFEFYYIHVSILREYSIVKQYISYRRCCKIQISKGIFSPCAMVEGVEAICGPSLFVFLLCKREHMVKSGEIVCICVGFPQNHLVKYI